MRFLLEPKFSELWSINVMHLKLKFLNSNFTFRYFSGNQVITQAVRPIKKGEIVPENYGSSFTNKSRVTRRLELADRYWFECACEVS